ncbi:MAG: ABC transporter permease subunit [Candidatus Ancillula trichonymphae]|nr:ABC transporter permease subunit [Candidatus Ancillula trichonymphae]
MCVDAAGVTVLVVLCRVVGSLLVGFALSVVRFFEVPVLAKVLGVYIELARNTPLIVQWYLFTTHCRKLALNSPH